MEKVYIYDTTLRDGSQAEGVNFSLEDKLLILEKLDSFGIDYIEGGWPGANPKDTHFFEKAKSLNLKHAKLSAFGSTRKPHTKCSEDKILINLLRSEARVVTLFGKSWDYHVEHALITELEENLRMIEESIRFMKEHDREVVFDAEHFFDGYKNNKEYALKVLRAAFDGGADWVVLCDTNGGTLPHEIAQIFDELKSFGFDKNLGIHAHNDSETAVSNSLMAVLKGARQVHGTINGIGERTGNANLCSIIPNLELKMGFLTVGRENLRHLTELSRFVSELSNIPLPRNMPFVGQSAFAHKGGVHASAVMKKADTYEHIDPELVGNKRKVTVSEMSGKSNILLKLKELNLNIDENSVEVLKLVEKIKEMEKEGYSFEAAEGSLELLFKRHFGLVKDYFDLDFYRIEVLKKKDLLEPISEASVKLFIEGQEQHTASTGDGPVNALDKALKKALIEIYPNLSDLELLDYKVRIVNETEGTAAKVRVLIESTDGKSKWGTVGVSENIIDASWIALVDSIIYKLMKDEE